MQDLIQKKQEIVRAHMSLMAEKQTEIMDKMEKSLPDKKDDIRFRFKMFEKINMGFLLKHQKDLHMTGSQRLQLAEIWSKNANNLLVALNSDPGYTSLMGNYDELIKTM